MSAGSFDDRVVERAFRAGLAIDQSDPVLRRLERYYELLTQWNRKINLTALPLDGYPDRTIDRLLIEPLLAASVVGEGSQAWLDLGTGGGSPAIPLKLVRPGLNLTMVESRERKGAFLREAIRVLDLHGADVNGGRIEELPASISCGSVGLVTARAVKLEPELLRLIGVLLAGHGRLVLFSREIGVISDDLGFELSHTRELPGGSLLQCFDRTS